MSLYFKEYGDKNAPTIVFLHGAGVCGWMWDKQLDYFKDYHIIIFDLPGHGHSKNENFISMRDSAEKIINLIESNTNSNKFTLVGFSLGAQIAVEILSLKPEIVDYAIITSALACPMKLGKKLLKPMFKMCYSLGQNKSFAKFQGKYMYIDKDYLDTYYNDSKEISLDNFMAILEANMSYSLSNNFNNSKAKTLILIGKKEKNIMKKSAVNLLKNNKYCTGYSVPKVGHGVSLANPDLFNRIVNAWISNEKLPEEIEPINI